MHPAHHQSSTAKPLDEERWLGFFPKVPQTAPAAKSTSQQLMQSTPSKVDSSQPLQQPQPFTTPEFKFRFKRQSRELSPDLSPEARKIMQESRVEAAKIRAQMVSQPEQFTEEQINTDVSRKIAKATGKAGRFSDVHMAQFKKMDSIANHPSSWRMGPINNQNMPAPKNTSLKRSPSKAQLDDHPERPATIPAPASSLKRSPSKARLDEPAERPTAIPASTFLKRSPSKVQLNDMPSKRAETTDSPAKRVKRTDDIDSSGARVTVSDAALQMPATPRPKHIIAPNSKLPRLPSSLLTPTKASLARSQSVKSFKTTNIPALAKSPSMRSFIPASASKVHASATEGLRKFSHNLMNPRSILRSPIRLYSNDPEKIAAGTHFTPPRGVADVNKTLPELPGNTPHKHVVFTKSTEDLARAKEARAASEIPTTSATNVGYPTLPSTDADEKVKTPEIRRTTLAAVPGDFTFRSDKPIDFGPATSGTTIRKVVEEASKEPSYPQLPGSTQKRKAAAFDEDAADDKENEEDGSPAKKMRAAPPPPPSASKLPRRQTMGRKMGGISQSRLSLLATPKRRR